MPHCLWIKDVMMFMGVPGLGFCPIMSIFGTPVPEIKIHPKLMELIRNKQNMNGTWCKARFIPEKLTSKM